jgi:protein-S-isoprenylcysteine O-methyltransferase Ste14
VLRFLPPTYLALGLILMIARDVFAPGATLVAWPWRWIGLVPIAAGIALNILADLALKRHQTTVKPFEPSTAIVTEGVFGLSRNPMYLGMALGLVGLACLLGSLTPWLVVIGFTILIERVFIRTEESKLGESFGEGYEAYRRRVRRWV